MDLTVLYHINWNHRKIAFIYILLIHTYIYRYISKHVCVYIHMCVHVVSVVQSLTCVWLFATPWTAAHHSLLSSTIPQVCLNSCQLSRWCYRTISLSATQFFHLPSFPASDSFPLSQFFTSGVQSIGVLASVSVLPMDIQELFLFEWTG